MLETVVTVGILTWIVTLFLGEPARRMVRATVTTICGLAVLTILFMAQIVTFVAIGIILLAIFGAIRLLWRIFSRH